MGLVWVLGQKVGFGPVVSLVAVVLLRLGARLGTVVPPRPVECLGLEVLLCLAMRLMAVVLLCLTLSLRSMALPCPVASLGPVGGRRSGLVVGMVSTVGVSPVVSFGPVVWRSPTMSPGPVVWRSLVVSFGLVVWRSLVERRGRSLAVHVSSVVRLVLVRCRGRGPRRLGVGVRLVGRFALRSRWGAGLGVRTGRVVRRRLGG
ncbi:hypothetical protein [Streptomyces chrestomyceticus]|uniref:hypothetical protein n=1 Tax=Streptomyces chrestomyceticus TaxID=68185 RepID=UPI0033D57D7D